MIRPETEKELAAAVKDARGALRVLGGGTRGVAGVSGAEELTVGGLSGVALYEPAALTLVVAAGTPVFEIEAVLAGEGQRLAFEPMDHRGLLGTSGAPTIGGVVAANISGPRRVQVGAARDFALGVRFVDGSGRVISNGGRVMKNVTGYDLVKLMAGSWGTLGVLSQVSLKVLPVPERVVTLRLAGMAGDGALAAMTRAMASPFDVSGAAVIGEDTVLRLEGFADSVGYRAGALADHLGDLGAVSVEDGDAVWQDVRDVAPLHGHEYVWRISMTPGAVSRGLLPALSALVSFDRVLDWAGGLAWIGVRAEECTGFAGGAGALHTRIQTLVGDPAVNAGGGGHAQLVKSPGDLMRRVSRFQPEPPAVAALSAGLRARFDPRGILNPGLMAAPELAEAV